MLLFPFTIAPPANLNRELLEKLGGDHVKQAFLEIKPGGKFMQDKVRRVFPSQNK